MILASSSDTTFSPRGTFTFRSKVGFAVKGCKEWEIVNLVCLTSGIYFHYLQIGVHCRSENQVMPRNYRAGLLRCQASFLLFLSMIMIAQSFVRLSSPPSSLRSTTSRFLTTNIFIVGKKNGGEQFISDGYAEYEKRLTPVMKINTVFLKSDEALVEATKAVKGTGKIKSISKMITVTSTIIVHYVPSGLNLAISILLHSVIALDENGSEYSSRDFSAVVYKGLEDGGANLTFVIGGFAGLPPDIKKSYPLMSLSKVTLQYRTRNILNWNSLFQ